jgi:hypothetical protein
MSLATARKVSTARPITKKSAPKAKKQVSERTAEIISGLFPEISSGARATHKYFATRDAINRQIDSYAAPEKLAAAAAALGMRPSETPVFLDLTTPEGGVTNG